MPEAPSVTLTEREQDDLDLLLSGALHPLAGFGGPETGVTLVVPGESVTPGDRLVLLDEEGAPLAEMDVTGSYPVDPTADRAGSGRVGVTGPVRRVGERAARPFERLYLPPAVGRPVPAGSVPGGAASIAEASPAPTLVVPTDRALTVGDIAHLRAAGRPARILALVGLGTPVGLSAPELIRACLAAAGRLSDAHVVAIPLARRGTARGDTARGDAARGDAARRDAARRDTAPVDRALRERVVARYAAGPSGVARVWWPTHDGDDVPPDPPPPDPPSSDPPPSGLLPRGAAVRGMVVLLTGLSGSGKSTIARGVRNALVEAGRRTVTLLDGDMVRRNLSSGLGFSRADRDTNVRRIGWVAAEVARHGGIAIACPIAPFAAARAAIRDMARDAGADFLLVHVATPLSECERRDRKGLYARARRGEIAEFTGVSSPYEEPDDADLRIDTTDCSADGSVALVLAELRRRGVART